MFTKRNLIIGGVIIMALLFVFYLGYNRGVINEDNKETKSKIEYIDRKIELDQTKIDSIKNLVTRQSEPIIKWKTKIIEIEKEYKDLKPPKDTVCNDLYTDYIKSNSNLKNQITLKDSIITNQDSIIVNQNLQLNLKDDIIKNKDLQMNLLKDNKKIKQKRIGLGLQLGMTINSDGQMKSYYGGGISYNFLNF